MTYTSIVAQIVNYLIAEGVNPYAVIPSMFTNGFGPIKTECAGFSPIRYWQARFVIQIIIPACLSRLDIFFLF
jgi:hypothetical protein